MRRIAVGALGVLIAGSIVGNAQQSTLPTFRAGTTLVDFTVVAADARGNPVVDLRKDEISIVEDESNRDVAFFQFEGKPVAGLLIAGNPNPLPPGTFTNRTEYAPNAPRHLIALVLDLINTSIPGQVQLQTELVYYLKQLPPNAHVGLYMISEHAIAIHDFTQDAQSLRTRLEKGDITIGAQGFASTRDTQGMLANARPEQQSALSAMLDAQARTEGDLNMQLAKLRRRLTLAAFDSIGHHLAGIPGRKSLVWISHGFALTDDFGTYTDQVSGMSQRLATQDVAVYPLEAEGVAGGDGSSGVSDTNFGASKGNAPSQNTFGVTVGNYNRGVGHGRMQGTGELMAAITGGRVVRNHNDLTDGLRAAADDLRGTYSVGFYAVDNPDNQWHRLRVKVSRRGVTVRHRQGYLAASTAINRTQEWPEQQWNDIAYRPLISTAVRLEARATFAAGALNVSLQVASDDLHFRQTDTQRVADVDIAVVEKTTEPTNVRVQSSSIDVPSAAAPPATVSVASEFRLNPATTSVRVILRDKSTGRYGSVDLPLAKLATQ